jgi:hypothetical protein
VTQAGLEHEIELPGLERQIGDRAELVELLQRLRRPGVDRLVVLDTPGVDTPGTQRADQFA